MSDEISTAHNIRLDPMQRYSLAEAADLLRVSRGTIYSRMRAGELVVIKDGARRFVPGAEIARKSAVPSRSR